MSIIYLGKLADLTILLVFSGLVIYLTYTAMQGRKYTLHRLLPAIEAIPEAVGRAVEMNRPIHYTTGGSGLTGGRGTHVQMGLIIYGHVAKWCARMGARLINTCVTRDIMPITIEVCKQAYAAEGQPDVVPDVRYAPGGDPVVGAVVCATMSREKTVVNMMIGGAGSDFPIMAEGGYRMNAFQIGGSANVWMIPIVVATCTYSLLGDELFAAGAILSEDSVQIASVIADDIGKAIISAIIIIGTLLMTAGIPIIKTVLTL